MKLNWSEALRRLGASGQNVILPMLQQQQQQKYRQERDEKDEAYRQEMLGMQKQNLALRERDWLTKVFEANFPHEKPDYRGPQFELDKQKFAYKKEQDARDFSLEASKYWDKPQADTCLLYTSPSPRDRS